jgi:leucyl aminopeptidase (aminopeptidase T)
MPDLAPAVNTVVRRCLDVKQGENVLVIVDRETQNIGGALRQEASTAGADAVVTIMDPRETDGTEPPPPIAAAMQACDVFIAPTSKSLSHTNARKQASNRGARGATMPGVTEDMLARVMDVDFEQMARRSQAVATILDQASTAHVSCPRGSDFNLDLNDRNGISDDGDLSASGAFGNLPCGEGFISPKDGDGRLVASSIAALGLSQDPAVLTIERGRLTNAEGGLGPQLLDLLRSQGEAGTNLAELGVGTNDRARLTGLILEDEKILGTVHIAFGASAGIGGNVSVSIHLDVVVLDASLTVDGQPVLEHGKFILDT